MYDLAEKVCQNNRSPVIKTVCIQSMANSLFLKLSPGNPEGLKVATIEFQLLNQANDLILF